MTTRKIIGAAILLVFMSSCTKSSPVEDMTKLNMRWAAVVPADNEYDQFLQHQKLVKDVETFISSHPGSNEAAALASGRRPVSHSTYPEMKKFIREREADYRAAHSLSGLLQKVSDLIGFSAEMLELEVLALSPHDRKSDATRVGVLLNMDDVKGDESTPHLLAMLRQNSEYIGVVDSFVQNESIELPEPSTRNTLLSPPNAFRCDDETSKEEKGQRLAQLESKLNSQPSPEEKNEILFSMLSLAGELKSPENAWSVYGAYRESAFESNSYRLFSSSEVLDAQVCAGHYKEVLEKVKERVVGKYKMKVASRLVQKGKLNEAYKYISEVKNKNPDDFVRNVHHVAHAYMLRGLLNDGKLAMDEAFSLIGKNRGGMASLDTFLRNASAFCRLEENLICRAFVQNFPEIEWRPGLFGHESGVDIETLVVLLKFDLLPKMGDVVELGFYKNELQFAGDLAYAYVVLSQLASNDAEAKKWRFEALRKQIIQRYL